MSLDFSGSKQRRSYVSFTYQRVVYGFEVFKSYLLENSLLEAAISCDGEPAPERVVPDILAEGKPGGSPNGERTAPPEVGSTGDVLDVGEVDRFWPGAACAKLPIVKCSDLAVDIIDYHSDRHQLCRDRTLPCAKAYVLWSQGGQVMGRASIEEEFELEVRFLAADAGEQGERRLIWHWRRTARVRSVTKSWSQIIRQRCGKGIDEGARCRIDYFSVDCKSCMCNGVDYKGRK